jgi:peroxiredoxin
MAETSSNPFPLGSKAPDFSLPDTISGKVLSLSQLASDKATVVMFLCNHCPYVRHVNRGLVELANRYLPSGVSFIAINSNDVVSYPEDSPRRMAIVAEECGYPFPYLYDETQEVARAYDAACTPEFYVFGGDLTLFYHGQMDDARPSLNLPVTGKDLSRALDLLLEGKPWEGYQKPGIGCNIKWKRQS